MRIFLGLAPNQALKNAVQAWREAHKDLPVTWLEENNLHITLIPPWDEPNVSYASKIVPELDSVSDLVLNFHTVELGPRSEGAEPGERIYHSKRLIWAVGEATPELMQYKYNAEGLFEKPHNPRFLLHLTIARLDPRRPLTFKAESVDWKGGAESAVLYEPKGNSAYFVVAKK